MRIKYIDIIVNITTEIPLFSTVLQQQSYSRRVIVFALDIRVIIINYTPLSVSVTHILIKLTFLDQISDS